MTGVVLALAGLTCGDGGPGMGAATAPAWVNPCAREWEGHPWGDGRPILLCRYRLRKGVLLIEGPRTFAVWTTVFRPDGALVVRRCETWKYSLSGGRLFLRPGDGLIVLHPAAPRKP